MLRKCLVTILVVLICVGSVHLGRYFQPKFSVPVIEEKYRQRSRGNPKSQLWIIEYLDFQCEACRESIRLMDTYLTKYPKDMYLELRYYPLIMNHTHALKSAIYSECASRQKKFRQFSEKIFETQSEWFPSAEAEKIFLRLARQVGMDERTLGACVEDPSVHKAIMNEKSEGKSLGVRMTPTFFVNGVKIEGLPAMKVELEKYFAVKKEAQKK